MKAATTRLLRLSLATFAGALAMLAGAFAAEPPPTPPETLIEIANIIKGADPNDIGGLFGAVRAKNGSRGAIISMRELNKAMAEGPLSTMSAADKALVNEKMSAAQSRIKKIIVETRKAAHVAFAKADAPGARTLSADGDVGSWRTSTDINSDVDWTAFGSDPEATARFVNTVYNPMLLKALGGDGDATEAAEILRREFDIVVTPQGAEKEAGVFETRGGKKLAMTVMTRVTPVNGDGSIGAEFQSDIGSELENSAVVARLRQMATRLDIYETVFDERGFLKVSGGVASAPAEPAKREAWISFMEAADDEGILTFDFKLVKSATLAGTCIDMAKHLHHEAIEKLATLDKKGQIKRIMKYPGRSQWAYGKSAVSDQLIEDYVVMGDPRLRRLIQQSAEFHRLKESKSGSAKKQLAALVDSMAEEYPDSEELGHLALEMIIRQSHLAMQIQVDRIAKSESKAERARLIQDLIDDFAIAADDATIGEYARAQTETLSAFKAISDDPVAFDAMRKSRRSIASLGEDTKRANLERFRTFMRKSELGGKILDMHEDAVALADRLKRKATRVAYQVEAFKVEVATVYEQLKDGSDLLQFTAAARESWNDYSASGGGEAKFVAATATHLVTLVDALDAVQTSKTDADLAINLGKVLWNNSGIGGLVNTLYAFAARGDNEAMARFIMFALCPEAAIPDLVSKLGSFAMRSGAQRLFDAQLEALYKVSRFAGDLQDDPRWKGKDAWLLADFAGYGAGVPAVSEFLDLILEPGGYVAAQKMFVKDGRSGELDSGVDAVARTAVVKAIWTTLQMGDPVVFRDDGALLEATQRIRFLTDQIIDVGKSIGKEIARSPENFAMPDGASAGEQAALNKLVKQREAWVDKAKAAMAEAIVRTFEERRRADSDLSDATTQDKLKALKALLTRLEILEPGLKHLDEDGKYNFIERNAPGGASALEQKRKMAQAVNRYSDAYTRIVSLRDALAQIVQVQTGAPPAKQPLTGAPPLCGERAIDLQHSQVFFDKARATNDETTKSLASIKGAALAGPFDDRIRHGINAAVIAMAEEDMTSEIARACRDLASTFSRESFTQTSSDAMQRFEAARLKRDALFEEFRAYYAGIKNLQAQIVVRPAAPTQGQSVEASLRVVGAVPEGASWTWRLDDGGQTAASGEGAMFRFQAPFRGAYTVTADLTIAGVAVKRFSTGLTVAGPASLSVSVTPQSPDASGAVSAQARLSPPRDGVDYEWNCANCVVDSARGATATLRAPDKGAASVRVRARDSATGATLGEASASFQVAPPGADKQPQTADTSLLPPRPPDNSRSLTGAKDGAGPTLDGPADKPGVGPGKKDNLTTVDQQDKRKDQDTTKKSDGPIGTVSPDAFSRLDWRSTLWERDDYRKHAQTEKRPGYVKWDADNQAAAEKHMRELWDQARSKVIGLPAFVEKYLAEANRIYAEYEKKGPPKPNGPEPPGGGMPGLDGETPWTRYACVETNKKAQAEFVGQLTALATAAKAAEAAFAVYDDSTKAYADAMGGYDALWLKAPGVYGITPDWRTKGGQQNITDSCGNGTTLKIAPGSAATPAMPSAVDKPKPSVTLALDAATSRGGEIGVVARASGGTPPYRYVWAGASRDNGDHAVYAAPVSGAKGRASVVITDATGAAANADLALEAPKIVVELVKSAPDGANLLAGQKATFAVRLLADGKQVDPSGYVLRWEPSTEARFDRPEGPGVAANAASFSRLGKTKVWVVALQRVGATLATVAESRQIELNVVGADITLQVSPQTPQIGQEVKVTASEQPTVPDKDAAYWWDFTGQAANAGATANPRVFSFKPKDSGPVVVTAHLKERTRGEELGTKSVTITATPFAVSIVNLGPAWENTTTRPVVWRSGKGFETLDRQIAARQDVALRADISPQPATTQLRYKWTVNQGGAVSGNPAARETRVQGANVGTFQASVEVRDADDVVLGTASASISVSVSDADIATGKSKTAEFAKLKDDSAKAWADGDLDTACDKGKAARSIDPAFALAQNYCTGRDRIGALVKEGEAALTAGAAKSNADRAQAAFDQARQINPKARALDALARKIADARGKSDALPALLAKAAAAWQAGDPAGAIRLADEAIAQTSGAVEAQQARKRYADGAATLDQAVSRAKTALGKKDIDGALAAVADGKRILANYHPLTDVEQEAIRAKQSAAQNDAERQRRLSALQTGAQACAQKRWQECKAAIEPALAGAASVFTPQDGPAVEQARKLLADANQGLAGAKDTKTPTKPATPAIEAAQPCREASMAAVARQQAGDARGAIPLYEQALAQCPTLCASLSNLAVAYAAVGNAAAAKDKAAAALRCDPANEDIRKIAGQLGAAAPQQGASTPDASKAAEQKNQCQAMLKQAVDMHRAGDAKGAIPLYNKAYAQCGDCIAAIDLASALHATGDRDGAKRWSATAARCDPNNQAIKQRADIYAAEPSTQQSLNATPQKPAVAAGNVEQQNQCRALLNQAIAKHNGGDAKSAIPLYNQVYAQCNDCIAAIDLASALHATGDRDGAKRWSATAARCDPNNQAIKQRAEAYAAEPSTPQNPNVAAQKPTPATVATTPDYCAAYMRRAIEQNQRNIAQRCGFGGGRWHNDSSIHTSWCLGVSRSAAQSEDDGRMSQLADCARKTAQSTPQQPQAQPSKPQPSPRGFDGTYTGPSRNGTATLTWVVSGSRIVYSWSNDKAGRRIEGQVNERGEFSLRWSVNIALDKSETTCSGKIVGDRLTSQCRERGDGLHMAGDKYDVGPYDRSWTSAGQRVH